MHEELFFDNSCEKTHNPNIMIEKIFFKKVSENQYVQEIEKMIKNLSSYESKKLKESLFDFV